MFFKSDHRLEARRETGAGTRHIPRDNDNIAIFINRWHL